MITAVVRFQLPQGATRETARTMFEASAPTYQAAPGLIRKYYLFGDGPVGGGIYLWEDAASADRFYTAEWRKALADRVGAPPQILLFDTPVIVDNATGTIESY